jgi:Uma2 family endonuclease
MTTPVLARPISVDEYDAMPDRRDYEFVDGKLVERNVSVSSSTTNAKITFTLGTFVYPNDLGHLLDSEMGFRINPENPSHTRRANVSFVSYARFVQRHDRESGYLRVAPELVVEVVSPGDLQSEVRSRVDEWLRFGVQVVWVAMPAAREIHVYAVGEHPRIYTAEDTITLDTVLPGFSAVVADVLPLL